MKLLSSPTTKISDGVPCTTFASSNCSALFMISLCNQANGIELTCSSSKGIWYETLTHKQAIDLITMLSNSLARLEPDKRLFSHRNAEPEVSQSLALQTA